jgi:hypothetical protein
MKLCLYTSYYPAYLQEFYRRKPALAGAGYDEQLRALYLDAYGWSDAYDVALRAVGYEVFQIVSNAEPLQMAWAREHNLPPETSLPTIALKQLAAFQPDILWFDSQDDEMLRAIKTEVASIRLALGWIGSALPEGNPWKSFDLVLSCAPEAVERLRGLGVKAKHLNHAFDERLIERLGAVVRTRDVVFVGQIVNQKAFHQGRSDFLLDLSRRVPVQIFSPSATLAWRDDLKSLVKKGIGTLSGGIIQGRLGRKIESWRNSSALPIDRRLKPFLKPAVFGLEMYRVIAEAKIVLNIHADSSPTYASNARLFETTGIGACLLTEKKVNLPSLFSPEREVVDYEGFDDCSEKISWLLNNDKEREAIAAAGQSRVLREHTFRHRAKELDALIRKLI